MNDVYEEIKDQHDEEKYAYFILKNGPRITSFRVEKRSLGKDLNKDIQEMLKIYPDGSEIYPITQEEHKVLHTINATRRRLVSKARKRCTDYMNPKMDLSNILDIWSGMDYVNSEKPDVL